MTFRRTIVAATAGFVLIAPLAHAADEFNVSTGVTTAGAPLGLHGADATVLSRTGEARNGSAEFTAVHAGVAYYFSSAKSMADFQADPERYLPRFGGYCAYAVALGKKFDGDPKYADIVDGSLYLFVNAEVFSAYQRDPEGTLAKAEEAWTRIKHIPVSDL